MQVYLDSCYHGTAWYGPQNMCITKTSITAIEYFVAYCICRDYVKILWVPSLRRKGGGELWKITHHITLFVAIAKFENGKISHFHGILFFAYPRCWVIGRSAAANKPLKQGRHWAMKRHKRTYYPGSISIDLMDEFTLTWLQNLFWNRNSVGSVVWGIMLQAGRSRVRVPMRL
jgi:hypothetical protein